MHQNTQALKPEIKTLYHENFQTPIFQWGSIHCGNGGGVYDLRNNVTTALWCLADHVRRDTISLAAAWNSTRRRIFMSLFSNGDRKIVENKWNVGVVPNVITCHRCISVTEHLDLRFRGLIPVCLVAMIWRFSVTMTTASPVRAWCSTSNCHSGGFIFPWRPNKWGHIIFILNEAQCLVLFKAKAFVFLIKVNLHLISQFLCKYTQMSALLVWGV